MSKIINTLIKLRTKPFIGILAFNLLKLLGMEIPRTVKIGNNVQFAHSGFGVIIHPKTVIEDDVKIFHNVTIGRADVRNDWQNSQMENVVIKKGAIIGAGAKVLCKKGTLVVGKNTLIGANSVLLKSTGENENWAGIPARKIKQLLR